MTKTYRRKEDALGNQVTYTPEGWLESQTKADGTQIRYTYDKTGNLLTQDVGEGQTIRSEYNDIGQMTVASSPEGDIRYQYDERGFLVSVENARGDVVHYAYDERGNKTEMTYPDGQMVSYTYDEMNRMTAVTSLDGEVTRYTYDAAGRRVQSASEQLTTVYEYDVLGNLTKQETTGQTAISFVYGYDARNSITGEVRTENDETTQSDYTYDPLGQLTSFTQSTGYAESYAYDKAGNMTQKVITGTNESVTTLAMKYNKGNQLTAMTKDKDSIAYTYDKNGNMTQKALRSKAYGKLTDSYAYNAQDMLTGYSGYDGFTQLFTYDANGMRLTKKEAGNESRSTLEELLRGEVAGLPEVVAPSVEATKVNPGEVLEGYEWATTEYLYDITAEYYQVIGETVKDKNGSTTTAYAYGIERIAAYNEGGKTSYVYDGRGSVAQGILTTPEAPKPQVQSYDYTAFGEQMGGIKTSGFTYNAEAYDAKTGMLNLRARQYEPAMNRFSQKDILRGDVRNPLSLNRYAYVLNDPINLVDPDGKAAKSTSGSSGKSIERATVDALVKSAKAAADAGNEAKMKAIIDKLGNYTDYLSPEAQKIMDSVLGKKGKGKKRSLEELMQICRSIHAAETYTSNLYIDGNSKKPEKEEKNANTVLSALQEITDDTLMYCPYTGKVYIVDQRNNSYPAGTSLIRNLTQAPSSTTIIANGKVRGVHDGGANYTRYYSPSNRAEVVIQLDGNKKPTLIFGTLDASGNIIATHKEPATIARTLSHELIHALHIVTNDGYYERMKEPATYSYLQENNGGITSNMQSLVEEERITLGVVSTTVEINGKIYDSVKPILYPEAITENAIAVEQGWLVRPAYNNANYQK